MDMSNDLQGNNPNNPLSQEEDDDVGMSERDWAVLLSVIKEGECTPFLGAGASSPPLPLGREIAQHLAEKFNYPLYDQENLPKVAQFVALRHDSPFTKREALAYSDEILRQNGGPPNFYDPHQIHRVLADLPVPIYLTTNYDDFMVKALQVEAKKDVANKKEVVVDYCRWNSKITNEPGKIDKNFKPTKERPLVYHIHGIRNIVNSMVLTEDDYIEFLRNVDPDKLHHWIARAFADSSLLFIGYGLEDYTFRTIFKSFIEATSRSTRRKSISVQLNPKSEARKRIKEILKLIQDDLVINLCHQIDPGEQAGINEIIKRIERQQSEKKVFSEINQLESKLTKLAVAYDEQNPVAAANDDKSDSGIMIHTVFTRINLLQTAVHRLLLAINAKDFLQQDVKAIDVSIYWGRGERFAKELRERCVKAGIIRSS
jgi:hypothetical protein